MWNPRSTGLTGIKLRFEEPKECLEGNCLAFWCGERIIHPFIYVGFAKMITIIGESLYILIRGYYMCDVMAKH